MSLLHSESIAYFSLSKNWSRSFMRRKGSLKRRHNYNKTLAATSIGSFTASLDDMTAFSIFFYLIFVNSSGLIFKSKFYPLHNVENLGKIKENHVISYPVVSVIFSVIDWFTAKDQRHDTATEFLVVKY